MPTLLRRADGVLVTPAGLQVPPDPANADHRALAAGIAAGKHTVVDEPPPPPPSYRDRRAVAYRDTLGKETGDYIKTLGDVLDVLIAEVEAIGQAANAPRTRDFEALLSAILAVKAAHPKPGEE